ncbi:WD40-repeat-containing domain protein [Pleurostoma richardsiae]|uniref:WD40-repeat-containing domain protein n=1 Tax=Pleurostoma richardsiae TaxID=41990 RepID=A0AA38RZ21_9PEZI|nr:WD40-repeat-containing domain protein [Pleurostoma richardsiae]
MSSSNPHRTEDDVDSDPDMLDEDEAQEVVEDLEGDVAMDSGGEEDGDDHEEIILQNDSIAYFDEHKDSVFAIVQHPLFPSLIATGGSEGDADDAPGKGYVFDASAAQSRPVLPPSYSSDPQASAATSTELKPLFAIDGHTDSINALAFTLPRGEFLLSAGMDGRLRAYAVEIPAGNSDAQPTFRFLAESQEVPEITWLAPCPAGDEHPNAVALGASDGSVWVYEVDASDAANPLRIVQSYFLHTEPCTAGAWTPDGALLATVSEDSSLYVWDVWGLAAAKGLTGDNGMTAVSLTAADQRFEVEGGLYAVAVEPRGAFLAAGGAGGIVKIVGLPRVTGQTGGGASQAKSKGKARPGKASSSSADPSAQAGQILASLQAQSDSVETLAFAPAPQTLLASGSVDGSVAVYDTSRSFAVRRHIQGAHDGFSVVKVEFVRGASGGWLLTSCGMDGVVRRWDLRGATAGGGSVAGAAGGLVKEWRGHRGDGEGGGVLGFVQGETGERVITAGDDGVALVFEA